MKTILFLFILSTYCPVLVGQSFQADLAKKAESLENRSIVYDPAYRQIPYPMGDVNPKTGVCTDVIIRAYRLMGIDLQKEVHEDMTKNFSLYPKNWGMKSTDKNIDHRRVPNLMTFFSRKGTKLSLTDGTSFRPGDVVCWSLGGGITHIGLIVHSKSTDGKRFLVLHNIGSGQVIEDCLFTYTLIGHYRYGK